MMKNLKKAWQAFKNNKKYLVLVIVLEIIFLIALTQIHLVFFKPTAEAAMIIGEQMTATIEKLSETEFTELNTLLLENEEFRTAYHSLLKYLAYFILSMLGAWIIFKTPIWYLAHKTIYNKMPFATHAIKFILLSLFWFAILMVLLIASTAQMPTTIIATVSMLIFLVIFYFTQISFSLIPAQQTFKKTFILGVKHARQILPAYIFNIILATITIALPFIWIKTIPMLSLAIIIIITIPSLAFARLNIIVATWQKRT
ncbi:hypothetical protein KY319_01240 [Candidatus Woesearchaeota archaeon]|nr:hypothetical protein [Candidatus Woesearchaeota archaeon]